MNIGILISGGGTTAQAIIHATRNGELQQKITPAVVICSNKQATGIEKIRALEIPLEILEKKSFDIEKKYGEKILEILQQYQVDFVSQNGWLPFIPKNVIDAFPNRIINQHPGPLDPDRPDFGGKGMYGARVSCARLLYCIFIQDNDPWTESDIHYVTEAYDKGNLIRIVKMGLPKIERRISIADCENSIPVQEYIRHITKQIQEKLLPIEHENIIAVLKEFSEGKKPEVSRKIPLIPEKNIELLHQAKRLAIQLFPQG